jgi:hypothetical protein
MDLLPKYSSVIANYCIYAAFIFFVFFLIYIITQRTANSQQCYTKVNQVNTRILFIYIFSLTAISIKLNDFDIEFLIGLFTGIFIYLSLHYVFVFSLIGLCDKSISIKILLAIKEIEATGHAANVKKLSTHMRSCGTDIEEIRKSRLIQMTYLGLAITYGSNYRISVFGRLIHFIGTLVLKIYGLRRL